MKKKTLFLLIPIGILLIGGFLYFKRVTILFLENLSHPRTIQIYLSPSEGFSIYYIHSIYNEPVIEEFQTDQNAIILKGVWTKSPGIMEYYGFEDIKEFHPMDMKLGVIFLRIAMGEGQGLIISDKKIYVSEIGEKGDRIQLRVQSFSMGYYLFSKVLKKMNR